MVSIRYAAVLAVLFIAASASAQQAKKGKVFTNDDVEQSAPPAPAVEAPAEKAPAAESKDATPAPAEAAGPQTELKKAKDFQAELKKNFEETVGKMDKETDPLRKERWIRMADCLSTLLQDNQRTISELEESSK